AMHPQATPTRLPRGPRRRLRCSSLKYSRYYHPTAQTTRGGDPGSRSSRLAGGAGPPTRLPRWGPRGASPVSVRRQTFTTGCLATPGAERTHDHNVRLNGRTERVDRKAETVSVSLDPFV